MWRSRSYIGLSIFVFCLTRLAQGESLEDKEAFINTTAESSEVKFYDVYSRTYLAQKASFGDDFATPGAANLMLAPDDNVLCEYPESLRNLTAPLTFEDDPFSFPIAFLVNRANCSAEQKARVALAIQQNVTSYLRYLIIYSGDPGDRDEMVDLELDNETSEDVYQSLGIMYISYSTASRLSEGAYAQGDPRFLYPQNDIWTFVIGIGAPLFDLYGSPDDDNNSDQFYWFRFVLFSLLIVSPCCRAGYLWYAGGGRFIWRRNERGRIIGIQYVPPMPYWLSSGARPDQPDQRRPGTLTEEQFNALPEIEYEPMPGDDDGDSSLHDVDIVVSDNNTCSEPNKEDDDESNEEIPDLERPSQQQTESDGSNARVTTSSTCSICIDDFEPGERLTLLPNCKHAFHGDCIKPWLMERQGCCPLCKKGVLQDDHETESDPSTNDDSGDQPSTLSHPEATNSDV